MNMRTGLVSKCFVAVLAAVALNAAATPAGAALPAVKSLTGTPISPSSADTYYGTSTTHSAGLCGLNTIMCGLPRAAAIVALARTLSQGGTLTSDQFAANVYEYVYKNIDTEFRYGLSKGAFGALLDQSGTPFDQAHLMVELLKEGATDFPTNYSTLAPTYQAGTVTLSEAAFASWTGITNAQAACQYLANGGIPASVNGSTPTSCTSLSGSVSTIVMSHIWVQATTSVSVKLYDPSYKVYTQKPFFDIAIAMGCGSYTASTCGSSALAAAIPAGSTYQGFNSAAQANYVQNVQYAALGTTLNGFAANLQHYIQNPTNGLQAAKVDDIVGGHEINPGLMPPPAASLSYDPAPTVQHSWTGDIPDQYRSRLNVQYVNINTWLYADETSGYWIYIGGNNGTSTYATLFFEREKGTAAPNTPGLTIATNEIVPLANSSGAGPSVTLTADHPYAANSGTYGDDTLTDTILGAGNGNGYQAFYCTDFPQDCDFSMAIIQSWGKTGRGNQARMSMMAGDKQDIRFGPTQRYVLGPALPVPSGYHEGILVNLSIPTMVESWLAQAGMAASTVDGINHTQTQEQHTIGWAVDQTEPQATMSGAVLLDAVGSLSVSSNASSATDTQAAFNTVATAYDALEGSSIEQNTDAVNGGNSIREMEKFNLEFFQATPANIDAIFTASSCSTATPPPNTLGAVMQNYFTSTSPTFNVVIPYSHCVNDGFYFGGPFLSSLAYALDGSALAYITATGSKGADAGITASDPIGAVVDTTRKAQSTKPLSFDVDAGSGSLTVATAPDLVTGSGSFPNSLSYQRFYNSWQIPSPACSVVSPDNSVVADFSYWTCMDPTVRRLMLGWDDNFQIDASFTNDGMRGLGADSALDASAAIAALYTFRDLNTSPGFQNYVAGIYVAAWLEDEFGANAVVIDRPPATETYLRMPDGTFNPRPGTKGVLTQTGARTILTEPGPHNSGYVYLYNYQNISFGLTDGDGSVLSFSSNDVPLSDILDPSVPFPWLNRFKPDSWTFPDGVKVSFAYTLESDPETTQPTNTGGSVGPNHSIYILSGVSNSLGRSLSFANDPNAASDPDGYTIGTLITDDSGRTVSVRNNNGSLRASTGSKIIAADSHPSLIAFNRFTANTDIYQGNVSTRLSNIFVPSSLTAPYLTFNWDGLRRVSSVLDANSDTTTYYPASIGAQENVARGAVVDALSNATTEYFDKFNKLLSATDPLGNVTTNIYDGLERRTQTTHPELNYDVFAYDSRSNLLSTTKYPVPGSSLSPIVTSKTYREGPSVLICPASDAASCNDPITATNGRGYVANYTWNDTTGLLTEILLPADVNSHRPETDLGYTAYTAGGSTFSLLTSKTEYISPTSSTVTEYTYNSANKYVLQTGVADFGTGHLNLTTTLTFDVVGNATQIEGPRTDLSTDITNYAWDVDRRLTSAVEANPGSGKQPTTEYGYDLDSQLITTNKGYVNSSCSVDTFGLHFCDVDTVSNIYDAFGNKLKEEDLGSGSSPLSLTQYTYDKDERLTCTAERMNTSVYSSLPASACTVSTTGAYGNDHIVENVYCAVANIDCAWNKVLTEKRGVGTSLVENYAVHRYMPNGEEMSVEDALSHTTSYAYDGFDRLAQTTFPDSTGPNPDKELITAYDNDGNILTKVNRAGETLTYTYDALDRMLTKAVPAVGAIPANTVTWGYDLINETTGISDTLGNTLTTVYDLAKRETSASRVVPGLTGTQTIGYQYTDGVNRTRLTWPDTSYYVNYGYDALNHILSASEQGLSYMANYGYDNVARRATLQYGVTAAEMSYSWSAQSDLLTLAHNFTGTTFDNTFTDTFTPSHQLATSTISNASYLLTPGAAGTDTYGATTSGGNANKLNQYPSFTPSGGTAATLSYDKNGNLATDGAWTYVYDPENRLMTANMSGTSVSYAYDPLGRRTSKTVNGTSTFFLDDGDTEIGEYDGSGNLLRRYVPGPNIDEPIAMVTPPSGSNPEVTKYFHYDKIGSVVAMSDAGGTIETGDGPYTYDVYGNTTAPVTGVPYRFTGQRLDPETGLYYYRARYYSPSLGRFLQVDPIGYKDDLDLYSYVGNDPMDLIDSSGETPEEAGQWGQNIARNRLGHSDRKDGYETYSTNSSVKGFWGGIIRDGFGAPKCNIFVYDALKAGGVAPGLIGGAPPRAKDWGNPAKAIGNYRVLQPGEKLQPGDVITNGEHVGIYTPQTSKDGTTTDLTTSAASANLNRPDVPQEGGPVTNNWAFRQNKGGGQVDDGMVVRRYVPPPPDQHGASGSW